MSPWWGRHRPAVKATTRWGIAVVVGGEFCWSLRSLHPPAGERRHRGWMPPRRVRRQRLGGPPCPGRGGGDSRWRRARSIASPARDTRPAQSRQVPPQGPPDQGLGDHAMTDAANRPVIRRTLRVRRPGAAPESLQVRGNVVAPRERIPRPRSRQADEVPIPGRCVREDSGLPGTVRDALRRLRHICGHGAPNVAMVLVAVVPGRQRSARQTDSRQGTSRLAPAPNALERWTDLVEPSVEGAGLAPGPFRAEEVRELGSKVEHVQGESQCPDRDGYRSAEPEGARPTVPGPFEDGRLESSGRFFAERLACAGVATGRCEHDVRSTEARAQSAEQLLRARRPG